MPRKEVCLSCKDCLLDPPDERFRAKAELVWNDSGVSGQAVDLFFAHHCAGTMGSGHNVAFVRTCEEGEKIGNLRVTRDTPSAKIGQCRLAYAGLELTQFGRRIT